MVFRIKQVLLGVLIVFAVSTVASASASALEWYKCSNVGANKGKFENNQCVKTGGNKEWELELLKELLKIVSKQTESFFLEGKLAGVTFEIKCEEQKSTGSIHNGKVKVDLPLESSEEVLTGSGLIANEFKKCTVPKPAGQGCQVGEPIVIPTVIQLSTFNGRTYILYSPDPLVSKTTFVEITLKGCTTGALNNTFPVRGMIAGEYNNSTSTVSFKNEEPNKKLLLGGNTMRFVGGSLMEMEGGGFVNTH